MILPADFCYCKQDRISNLSGYVDQSYRLYILDSYIADLKLGYYIIILLLLLYYILLGNNLAIHNIVESTCTIHRQLQA